MRQLADLFDIHDAAFVELAYEIMFRRKADPAGLTYYVDRLRKGYSRIAVLNQLAKSPEANPQWSGAPRLREKLDNYRSGRRSIWRLWRARYDPETGMAPRLRRARAIENAIGRGRQDTLAAFAKISVEMETLRGLAQEPLTDQLVACGAAFPELKGRSVFDVREFDLPPVGRKVLSALNV